MDVPESQEVIFEQNIELFRSGRPRAVLIQSVIMNRLTEEETLSGYRILLIITASLFLITACTEQGGEKQIKKEAPESDQLRVQLPDSLTDDDLYIRFVYAEERLWETSRAVALDPPPRERYADFDSFFVVLNSNNAEKQHPIAEIGPPRADYDGQWRTFTVIWNVEGLEAYETVPIMESYDDILVEEGLGHIIIEPGSPKGGPPDFFSSHLNPLEPIDVIRE